MLIAEITSPMGPSYDKHILLDVKIMEINECSFYLYISHSWLQIDEVCL